MWAYSFNIRKCTETYGRLEAQEAKVKQIPVLVECRGTFDTWHLHTYPPIFLLRPESEKGEEGVKTTWGSQKLWCSLGGRSAAFIFICGQEGYKEGFPSLTGELIKNNPISRTNWKPNSKKTNSGQQDGIGAQHCDTKLSFMSPSRQKSIRSGILCLHWPDTITHV